MYGFIVLDCQEIQSAVSDCPYEALDIAASFGNGSRIIVTEDTVTLITMRVIFVGGDDAKRTLSQAFQERRVPTVTTCPRCGDTSGPSE